MALGWTQFSAILGPQTGALALGALALAVVVGLEAVLPFEIPRSEGRGSDRPWQAPVLDQDFQLPELDRYAEVVERPLFVRTRRPVPPAAGPQAVVAGSEGRLGQYALSGVVITPEERFAILRGTGDNKLHRVADGQDFQGWTVQAIQGEGVVFAREGEEQRMPLVRKTPERFKIAAQRAALLGRRSPPRPPQADQQTPPPEGVPVPPAPDAPVPPPVPVPEG